jgi:tryptophan synthase alpha chain
LAMNRIDAAFKRLRARKEKAFIAYITAGDPCLAMTKDLVLALESSGADIVELGVPFSDPVADGPVIQAASQRALAKKVTVRKIFSMVRALRARTQIPIVFMTYYNPVLRYGLKDFFAACRSAGVDGVIVPDLPCEESRELIAAGSATGVATIFLIAPTSTPRRVKDITSRSMGFIYYVSLTGVTGARRALPRDIVANIRRIKSVSDKPVAVGFGVSNARQAADLAKVADGVIVGSAIVKIIGEKKNIVPRVSRFAARIAKAIHNA